ncbi:MAG: magnesium transporter [Lysobacteraceae bacterium]
MNTTRHLLDGVGQPGHEDFDHLRAAGAVTQCLDQGQADSLKVWLADLQPADIADVLAQLDQPHASLALALLPITERAEVFGYLAPRQQAELVAALRRQEIAELFHEMSADERADLFNALDEQERERVLPVLAQAEREDIRRLSAYAEGTAGAVMTSEYATLEPELTAREALEALRRVAPDKETIYNAFVLDADRRILGVVSLRDLIVALPSVRVAELMETHVVTVHADDPAKSAAEKVARYDLGALPVINGGDRMVGIITADDAMDVAEAESTESFHRVGTVSNLGVSLREAGTWLLFQKRVFWLVLLVFGNLFSGAGIAFFEDTIAAHIALVFFLPLLIDSGGNAGSQSATLMVRALATGDVVLRDWGRMLGREFGVAVLLGAAMAVAVAGLGLFRGGPEIAMVVSLTMIIVVIVGSLIGMSLPFVLSKLKFDPATASAPLITSIADAVGVLIYFGIATAMLPGLAEMAAA